MNSRFNPVHVLIVGFGFLLFASENTRAQNRIWTDSTGVYKIRAKLVLVHEVSGEMQAELLQEDGKRMAIPVSKLSQVDRKLARKFHIDWINGTERHEPKTVSKLPDNSASLERSSVNDGTNKVGKSRGRIPEEDIVSRPLRSPLDPKLQSEKAPAVNIEFDPETAVRLEREIERDDKGRAVENPVYKVEVDESELESLPSSYQEVATLLNDNSTPIDSKRRAIERFTDNWPQRRYPVLVSVLINCLSDDDKFLRLAALDLLANHDAEESIHYILARIDDVSFDVRWRTYEVLSQIRDPRVIPELCERLDTADCRKIASVLQMFGSTSNPWIHPWLERTDLREEYMLEICKILCTTGDFDSIQALSNLKSHNSRLVQRQANYAVGQIEKRLKATAAR